MNTLDIILLVTALIGFIIGFRSGLIKQLTLGAGIAIGLLLAVLYYPVAGEYIKGYMGWENWICSACGFAALMVSSIIVLSLIGMILKWLLSLVFLGILDRLLGAIFTIAISMLALTFVVNISSDIIPENNITGKTSQKESVLYSKVSKITFSVIEEIKKDR